MLTLLGSASTLCPHIFSPSLRDRYSTLSHTSLPVGLHLELVLFFPAGSPPWYPTDLSLPRPHRSTVSSVAGNDSRQQVFLTHCQELQTRRPYPHHPWCLLVSCLCRLLTTLTTDTPAIRHTLVSSTGPLRPNSCSGTSSPLAPSSLCFPVSFPAGSSVSLSSCSS